MFAGITVAILLLSSVLLYLTEDNEESLDDIISGNGLVPVWERGNQPFNTTETYSYTLEKGEYEITGPQSIFVEVDLPTSELGCTITDDCQVHLGLWLPNVPNVTKLPVIAYVGTY